MILNIDKKTCDGCNECLKNCPHNLQVKAINCKHCNIESAPCKSACTKNAFFEVAEGILSIDRQLCDGCSECARSCPKNAICKVDGKASKCDLCAENYFLVSCVSSCPKNAIEIMQSKEDIETVEQTLGWRIEKIDERNIEKVLENLADVEIVRLRNQELVYVLKEFPSLSGQESKLINVVLKKFQNGNFKGTKEKNIFKCLKRYCIENLVELSEEQKNYFLSVLNSLVTGFGPLSTILDDDSVEEIAVIGLGSERKVLVFHKFFGWMKTNFYFAKELTIRNLINKMSREIGRRITMQTPKLNATLFDGSRISAAIAPITFSGPTLTIRKFKKKPFTPIDLINNKTISSELAAFLWMTLQTNASILIAGNTGSGKTSTLNALFSFVPKNERIIVTEETPEISLPHEHIVKLKVVENLKVGMQELIVDTLRMRPDRVIVGEIRNAEEVNAFIDTLLAGQGKGSYATFHSTSSEDVVTRLKNFNVSEMDIGAIDLIVVQKRWNKINLKKNFRKEVRRVTEVCEVFWENSEIKLNPLFEFNYKLDKLQAKNQSKRVLEKIKICYSMTKKQVERELMRRKLFLNSLKRKKPAIEEFFSLINSWC